MMNEREELMAKRRELSKQLEKDLVELHETTLYAARLELQDRAMLYFDETDLDGDGMHVDSEEWTKLQELMAVNGIHLDESIAGDDKTLSKDEFEDHITESLEEHFAELKKALQRNEALKEEIQKLEMSNIV